jgi:chemotaxis protein CheX
MDDQFLVKSVVSAAKDVCGMMLGLEATAGDAYIEQNVPTENERVVALIGLAGTWIGTGMISCSPDLACKISSLMLMTECEGVSEDVLDAMAEMANMIYGNVKTELEEEVGGLGLSIPTVIFGRNFATRSVGKQSWTVVPLHIQGDNGPELMELKICLTKNQDYQQSPRPHMRPYSVLREEM